MTRLQKEIRKVQNLQKIEREMKHAEITDEMLNDEDINRLINTFACVLGVSVGLLLVVFNVDFVSYFF